MSKFQDYVPQPFPIYKALALHPDFPNDWHYQNHRLDQCKGNTQTFQNTLPTDGTKIAFPPFIIRRPSGGAAITQWKLYRLDAGGTFTNLNSVTSSIENLDNVPTWEAVIFPSQSFNFAAAIGVPYFISMTDGTSTWYSDIFVFSDSDTISGGFPFGVIPNPCGSQEFIQINWESPDCVISEMLPTGTGFNINLPVNISQPKYEFVSEQEDDGEGGSVGLFKRLDKRYTFFIIGPEWLADALTAMQLFPNVGISLQYGDSMNARDIQVEVDWEQPCFAKITVSFATDFLKLPGCCL